MKMINLTNLVFDKLTVIKRVNSKWLCHCDCGNECYVLTNRLTSGKSKDCGCVLKSKRKELDNQKFGSLTVIRRGNSNWLCRCDCGNECYALTTNLISGHTKNCGCDRKTKLIDLTNKKFGNLTVIKRIKNIKRTMWLCHCDCGNKVEFSSQKLISNKNINCGCNKKRAWNYKDLTGFYFGKLKVIQENTNIKQRRPKWLCECECGNKNIFSSQQLLDGNVKNCGCSYQEKILDFTKSNQSLKDKTFYNWKVLDYSHSENKRNVWKIICLNCGIIDFRLTSHIKRSNGCRNCYIKPKGWSGLNKLYSMYFNNANKNNRIFKLSLDEFKKITSNNCYYCGSPPLSLSTNEKLNENNLIHNWGDYLYNGIDRVDNLLGYEIDNCVSCCCMCNRAKQDMLHSTFIEYIKRFAQNVKSSSIACLNSSSP